VANLPWPWNVAEIGFGPRRVDADRLGIRGISEKPKYLDTTYRQGRWTNWMESLAVSVDLSRCSGGNAFGGSTSGIASSLDCLDRGGLTIRLPLTGDDFAAQIVRA
jgi:hypothetical protein